MRRALVALATLAGLATCHPAAEPSARETNAAALEANLEQQANAMEAQADATADRNAADAVADNAQAPANGAMPQP